MEGTRWMRIYSLETGKRPRRGRRGSSSDRGHRPRRRRRRRRTASRGETLPRLTQLPYMDSLCQASHVALHLRKFRTRLVPGAHLAEPRLVFLSYLPDSTWYRWRIIRDAGRTSSRLEDDLPCLQSHPRCSHTPRARGHGLRETYARADESYPIGIGKPRHSGPRKDRKRQNSSVLHSGSAKGSECKVGESVLHMRLGRPSYFVRVWDFGERLVLVFHSEIA